ncbi:MAG: glycosyl transferase, partial [Hyphomicrobiales bacterium]
MPELDGKTILQILPTLKTGGAERTVVDMTRGIVDAGGRALVASAGGGLVQKVEDNGGTHFT